MWRRWFVCVAYVVCLSYPLHGEDTSLAVTNSDSAVTVTIDGVETLRYVFHDHTVGRPYFTPVNTRSGVQISRNHPPIDGQDKTDHLGLHTGIWLSFGDLSGNDYWRLKAKTEHLRFTNEPAVSADRCSWEVRNRYLSADGKAMVCEESASYVVRLVPGGYLLEWTSTFEPGDTEIVFGDQEEMGLGIRVNTPMAVESGHGGRILDQEGRRNGKEVWGKSSAWCDYSGQIDSKWVGITVMSSSKNFRPSWNHARDYGFLAVNPFGRSAFTGGEPSRVIVRPGEVLTLKFGIFVHESAGDDAALLEQTWRDFEAASATSSGD